MSMRQWSQLGSITALIAALGATSPVTAADLSVPGEFASIQEALDASVSGDRVVVEPGIYVGGIDFAGKDVRLESTGAPSETVIDANGRTGVQIGPFGSIEGFTIRNAAGSSGAGMRVFGAGSVIRGNVFDNNVQGSGGFGAGIAGNSASPTIDGNLFRNHFCDGQFLSAVITFVNSSSPTIVNNVFAGNECRGVNLTLPVGNSPAVVNNTFVANRVAIRVDARVATVGHNLRNNLIVGNQVGLEVGFLRAGNGPVWENNLVFGNEVNYVGLPDPTGTRGNLSADPLLLDLENGDFRLTVTSPAIDAGAETLSPAIDFDGVVRPVDGDGDGRANTDIGAFEFTEPPPPLSLRIEIDGRRGARVDLRKRVLRLTAFLPDALSARDLDLNHFSFGPAGAAPDGVFFQDVDRDEAEDLVLFFPIADLGFEPSTSEACLSGNTLDGIPFEACEDLRVYESRRKRVTDWIWFLLQHVLGTER